MMSFVDILIMIFWHIQSSHGHVLLNMHYNTTLIAIISWLKACLTSRVFRLKGQNFNAMLRTFRNQRADFNQVKCNAVYVNDRF